MADVPKVERADGCGKRSDASPRRMELRFERVAHPSFYPELVPIFMMIETDLFRRLNEKAALRSIGYDTMLRIILREHLSDYE